MIYRYLFLACMIYTGIPCLFAQDQQLKFRDPDLTLSERLEDLLDHLTVDEKISLLGNTSPGVERLGIEPYNWWNEALHGVARNGEATIFPQAIGMAATFNENLMKEVATVISTEARAKYNLARANDQHLMYQGLTFWSPNINIFRDPRWGRGQETYGEDPFLTAAMGTAFVKGMQGDGKILKTSTAPKHYAVHSGPEAERHGFNAIVDEKDLRETYLYAFRKLIGAGAESIMCAYNRVNGEPCCTSNTLLQDILLKEWQFDGHIVTDCGALSDIWHNHKTAATAEEVAAQAIKRGISIDCSTLLQHHTKPALEQGLLTEADIDKALLPALRAQFRLGMFDPSTPYDDYSLDSIANQDHIALSRKMAQESIVLLKNDHNILPLDQSKYKAYMLLGPNAASLDALIGNYHGVSSQTVTFVDGFTQAVGAGARIEYDMGCDYADTTRFGGIWAAGNAELSIAFLGLTPVYEGENGDAFLAENGADRLNLGIPKSHIAYLKALRAGTKNPIIVVLTGGSSADIEAISPYSDAILMAWYPGQQGGHAVADVLFGKVSPSGRLPVTFYKSLQDLPDYRDYSMADRTYRYFEGEVQFPFGFGLTYTTFQYEWVPPFTVKNDTLQFAVRVTNTGKVDAQEVIQTYIQYPDLPGMPNKELKAFQKVELSAGGDGEVVHFALPIQELEKWDDKQQKWKRYPGKYTVVIGSHSVDEKLRTSFEIHPGTTR
ncbi:MAG: glycoside hydrolase family 3 C-terminal domain-containing protein [Lewinella sp.]|nr:glycoside hydrolase family 3 C-terminal domain-containing protein [Lewinella sp.]